MYEKCFGDKRFNDIRNIKLFGTFVGKHCKIIADNVLMLHKSIRNFMQTLNLWIKMDHLEIWS